MTGSEATTGLDVIRQLMAGEGTAPIGKLLDFYLVEAQDGHVVFAGKPATSHYNPQGIVHGGYAATLLDSAMGCAIQTRLGAQVGYTTVELKINYVRAMTEATGEVRASGTAVHVGRRLATAEGRLIDAGGRLLAHGSTTCMVFEAPVKDA